MSDTRAAGGSSAATSPAPGTGTTRRAAIDIGTVTTRLLIADVTGDGQITECERIVRITQLGRGLAQTGRLGTAGLQAVLDQLDVYAALIADYCVAPENLRAVATSAARDAANANELLSAAAARGVPIQVIDGDTEARLAYTGATYGRMGRDLLVCDPGGGSTEFVLGDRDADGIRLGFARSLDIGSRRLTDMFLQADPPTPGQLADCRDYVCSQIDAVRDALPRNPRELIAVAGTATSMVTVKHGIVDYRPALVQGQVITRADMEMLVTAFATVPTAVRATIPGLEPDRAGVVLAGALILAGVLDVLGLDRFTVSDTDLLHGLVLTA
ncbi:MAG: Ppx/GppA family phosphatase [Actinomycetes bacterium]|jgi:exopolyphosphatase/guanosine-5'-triphosphate,3'-diphosphate pyrophosphatase|nr:Ppx/GppA family phosphatase [Actinomycetes bacterium]